MKKIILLSFLSVCMTHAHAQLTFTNTVDDFAGLNTDVGGPTSNNLSITKAENSIELKFGPGTSSLGRDAFGTGTSTFGQTGAWFDGSYAKFGNSGNQQLLDIRITNNTGLDAKLTNISFDIRKAPANANPTGWELKYLASGASDLRKGATFATGTEIVDLNNIASGSIAGGINNYSESIGANISGTAWIAAGGYANVRLKILTGNTAASSQMDNFSVTLAVVPEPGTYALLLGQVALVVVWVRRRNLKIRS